MNKSLFKGHRILFNKRSSFDHYAGGEFDGDGGACPNCGFRLVIYLNLDLTDQRIDFPDSSLGRLPLVYCLDCELCYFDFVYRMETDERLKILSALRSNDGQKTGLTSSIRNKHIDVDLSPVSPELESLAAKLNADRDLTKDEKELFARLTDNFAPPDLGRYPIVDCYNQIGGRAFLVQRLEDPMCEYCPKSRMRFLASIYNEKRSGVEIVPDDMQIVYFACPKCSAILAQHSAS